MSKEDGGSIDPKTGAFEEVVAHHACLSLARVGPECSTAAFVSKAQCPSQLAHTIGNQCALGVNAVVEVGTDEIPDVQGGGAAKQIEERNRIRATGSRNECPSSRERKRHEVLAKRPEHVHVWTLAGSDGPGEHHARPGRAAGLATSELVNAFPRVIPNTNRCVDSLPDGI